MTLEEARKEWELVEQSDKEKRKRDRRYYLTGILTGLLLAVTIVGIVFLVRDVRSDKNGSAQT